MEGVNAIGMTPLGRPRYRRGDKIRMDRNRHQYKELDLFGPGQGFLEIPCDYGIAPLGSISHGIN